MAPSGIAVQVAGELLIGENIEDLLILALAEDRAQDVQLHAVHDEPTEVEGVVRLGLGTFTEKDRADRNDLEEDHEVLAGAAHQVEGEHQLASGRGLVEDVRVLPELLALDLVEETDADGGHAQLVLGQFGEEPFQLLDVLRLEVVGVAAKLLRHGRVLPVLT